MKKIIIIILVFICTNLTGARITLDTSNNKFTFADERVNFSYPVSNFSFENEYFSLSNLSYKAKLQSVLSPNSVFLEKMNKKSVYGLKSYGLSIPFSNFTFYLLTKDIMGLSFVYENRYLRIGSAVNKSLKKEETELFFDPSYMGNKLVFSNTIQANAFFFQLSFSSSHAFNLKSKYYFSLSLFHKDLSLYYLRGDINTIEKEKDITREAIKLSIDNKVFQSEILIKKGRDPIRLQSYRSQSLFQITKLKYGKYFFQSEYSFEFTENGKLNKKYNFSLGDEVLTIKTDEKLKLSYEIKIKEMTFKYKNGELQVDFDFQIKKDFNLKFSLSSKGEIDTSITFNL